MDLFVQMLERNFGFFHRDKVCGSRFPFKNESSPQTRCSLIADAAYALAVAFRLSPWQRERRAFGRYLQPSIQGGIDKWRDSSLIQQRNPDEPNCNHNTDLSDLQQTEIA